MTELYKRNGAVFIPIGITLEEIDALKKENAELKAWIEKNKCCEICGHYNKENDDCSNAEPCNDYDKWELAE